MLEHYYEPPSRLAQNEAKLRGVFLKDTEMARTKDEIIDAYLNGTQIDRDVLEHHIAQSLTLGEYQSASKADRELLGIPDIYPQELKKFLDHSSLAMTKAAISPLTRLAYSRAEGRIKYFRERANMNNIDNNFAILVLNAEITKRVSSS